MAARPAIWDAKTGREGGRGYWMRVIRTTGRQPLVAAAEGILRGLSGQVAVWTGSQMLIWGGTPARDSRPQRPFADGAVYTPYPL